MNETAKQVLKSMKNANYQPKHIKSMKQMIKINNGKVIFAEIDPDRVRVKFDGGLVHTIENN